MNWACQVRRPPVQDALIALVFVASTTMITIGIDRSEPGRHLDAVAYAIFVGAGAFLAVRRVWPVPVLYGTTVLAILYLARHYDGGPLYLAPFFAVGTLASLRPAHQALGPVVLAMAALGTAGVIVEPVGEEPRWAHLLYVSWAVLAFLIGKAMRDRRELLAGLHERARYLEETREEEARRRVAEERVRIARDLHDIVAHNIAGISLQAATGAHVASRHPEQAQEALQAIRQASRQTLDELRSTLHLLREGDEAVPLAPTPGLDDLPELAAFVERSGVPVELRVDAPTDELTEAVGVAAYRIIQESLTNVMRHAGPARASVGVALEGDELVVTVTDDGRGAAAVPPEAEGLRPGHGVAGMKERALALGGTVEAGPRPGGGYQVLARLPVVTEPVDEEAEPAGPRDHHAGHPHDEVHPAGHHGVRL